VQLRPPTTTPDLPHGTEGTAGTRDITLPAPGPGLYPTDSHAAYPAVLDIHGSDATAEPACLGRPNRNGLKVVADRPVAGNDLERVVRALRGVELAIAAEQAELAGVRQRVEAAAAAASELLSEYAELLAAARAEITPTVEAVDLLTAQESIVVRLLAEGQTDDVVARRLGVSARTVRRIVTVVMRRLDARSRFEAGVHAVQRGWLSPQS
jgi:DNA-binding CsgD family transcriptional regulator